MMPPHPVTILVQVVYLKNALEIFSVLQVHHAKRVDPSSVAGAGMKQRLHALCHAKMV